MSRDVISKWFTLYGNDIYHYLIYFLGSHDVEDLVQEVFMKAIKNIDTFEEKSSPKTWLFSIARHVAIDEIRRKQRTKLKNWLTFEHQKHDESLTPEEFLQLNETNQDLYKAIQRLKKNYRDVVILRAIKDLSISETAEILNWKEEKVRLTFHRAIKALQKEKERFM